MVIEFTMVTEFIKSNVFSLKPVFIPYLLQFQIDDRLYGLHCESRKISPAYSCFKSFLCPTEVTEVVILLQIRQGHLSASHYFISEIPEFVLLKFRNFGMCKRPKIPESGNSGIAITRCSLCKGAAKINVTN